MWTHHTSSNKSFKSPTQLELDNLLLRLESAKDKGRYYFVPMSELELLELIDRSRQQFLSESMLLELNVPIKIFGDTHGQFYDLLRIFDTVGKPPSSFYLFLGDYVDRGQHSIENISLLLCYKLKYPNLFYMLRGNHESEQVNRVYGFYDECRLRYSRQLWEAFLSMFDCMPIAALIANKVFCSHGGLSPNLNSFDDIRKIVRPTEVPDNGLMCDLLWADPDPRIIGFSNNDRGVSYIFGVDAVEKFLKKFNIELIVRAHQVVENGYSFFARKKLITLFSAPNYCDEFDNAAAVMLLDNNFRCTFRVIKPEMKKYIIPMMDLCGRNVKPVRTGGTGRTDEMTQNQNACSVQEDTSEIIPWLIRMRQLWLVCIQ
ncbi:hypothetical protein GJ496_003892 [Pomphorhynchus laevis]|nr:hypothetical protein GJ496_003892 [Pomphorhynchus laevis]